MRGPLVASIDFCRAQSHFHWGLNSVERTSQLSQISWTAFTDQRNPGEADDSPTQQEDKGAQSNLKQRHCDTEASRVLHFFEGVEQTTEGIGPVGNQHYKRKDGN